MGKKKKKKGKKKATSSQFQISLNKRDLLAAGFSIVVVLFMLLFFQKSDTFPSGSLANRTNLDEDILYDKEKLISDYLVVKALDKTWDGDGLTSVSFKNTSEDYIFDLNKIGIKHQLPGFSKKTAVTFPVVSIIVQPQESIVIHSVSIPNGVKPLSAYALLDDVKVLKK